MKTVLHGRRPEFIALCLCALFLSRSGDSVAATTQGKLPDGKFLYVVEPGIRNYLEYGGPGVPSPILRVTDTRPYEVIREVGPFGNFIRPFTVNGRGTLCFVNVNELLGFEVGDLVSGKKLHRVEVKGFEKGPTKRHGCPSHG